MNNTPFNGDEPAFPVAGSNYSAAWPGMTLRDWFAGMALQGLIIHNNYGSVSDGNISLGAYAYADAMLATLNQTEP